MNRTASLLYVELLPRRRRVERWHWVALVIAAVVLWNALETADGIRAQLAAARQPATRIALPVKAALQEDPKVLDAARDVVRRLTFPWQDMLLAVKRAHMRGILLASFTPDPQRKSVEIEVNASDWIAAVNYANRLAAEPGVGAVQILEQRPAEQSLAPAMSLRVRLLVSWAS